MSDMSILLLCGYFEPKYEAEIVQKTKTCVENAANIFQGKLIEGLRQQSAKVSIVSAPFIGTYPSGYKDIVFKGFCDTNVTKTDDIEYVHFNNIWGYRNISRTTALKEKVNSFLCNTDGERRAIIVYSPHTPFLKVATLAKEKCPDVHVCLVVPDLPQYMNLSIQPHPIYDFFKKIDINNFNQLNKHVDSYMLLTRAMADSLAVGSRPYFVAEGIISDDNVYVSNAPAGIHVAYAGKLMESFGVKRLIDAFELIEDKSARLTICGGGELQSYVEKMAIKDKRIQYLGVILADKATELLRANNVLVNPRQNDSDYTKYSFPSKNIEYLLTGNSVVAYILDGMPEVYREMLVVPKDNDVQSLAEAIIIASKTSFSEERCKFTREYLTEHLHCKSIANKIYKMVRESI